MKPLRTQPFFGYAVKLLPTSSLLEQAIAEYLGMRLHKEPSLQMKVWEACIDELVSGMRIDKSTKIEKPRQRHINAQTSQTTVGDLIYMFQVATLRGWNHVYFTKAQDTQWNNISYYQDPYWHKLVSTPSSRKELYVILYGTEG